ncbi:MAG: hypothetical protein Q8Q88_21895 [Phenylobacterium sp.]|uniref:hypothetical protein n=1 Tax=Phenylobacterium sp. TaxID=1871053 RepID=UPI002733424A|nr:hypothetical protein [Phenylobacterium sp.]MDP3749692.1 hypothetical protein [Phenylobacterium sp.]
MPFDIVAGGTGRQDDVGAVAAELSRLPGAIALEFTRRRIKVVACRGNVTDFAPELADPGEVPEGWPEGASWTTIPGAYVPARRAVVIATLGPEDGPRRVPICGEGHGARSLAVHEAIHGYDYASGDLKSRDPAFRRAWTTDKPLLGSAYFSGDEWGPRESYAESAAQQFGADQSQAGRWPNLAAYWRAFEPFAPSRWARVSNAFARFIAPVYLSGQPIGHGVIQADGTIQLDLTAHSKSGAIGHGRLTVSPGDRGYEDLLARVTPKLHPVDPAVGPATQVLVWPQR